MRRYWLILPLFLAGCLDPVSLGITAARATAQIASGETHTAQREACEGEKLEGCVEAELDLANPEREPARKAFEAYLDSPDLAAGWPHLCNAALLGVPDAQLILARAYAGGWPPANEDTTQAYLWYSLAIYSGYGFLTGEREALTLRMTDKTKSAVRQRLGYWQPGTGDCDLPNDPAVG